MKNCDIALYGLGVMGSSLAKNMIHHDFRVAAYSKSDAERARFAVPGKEDHYAVCADVREMVESLKTPRIIFMMVTAGPAVDSVIAELVPFLEPGDVLFIDEGFGTLDSDYLNTVMEALEKLHQIGGKKVGIISHVEALRERIATQIHVERVNHTLSRVEVVNTMGNM